MLGGPYGWLGGLEAHPKGTGGVGSSTRDLGGVTRPSRREGRGLGALLESREGLRGPEEVGSLSQRARRGRVALLKVRM